MAERINVSHVPGCLTFADGRVPDNDSVRQPPRQLPLATRQVITGWIIAGIFLVLMVAGIAREVLS